MFQLKVLTVNKSKDTHHIVKFFIGFDALFLANFVDFQNETAGLCVNGIIIKLEVLSV